MLKEIFTKEIAKLGAKKSHYIVMTWKSESENGEWLKLSRGVVRLWTLEPLQSQKGHYYIRMRTTKNKKQKVKVQYFHWGEIVDETEYYKHNEKKNEVDDWFTKRLNDIVKVGA